MNLSKLTQKKINWQRIEDSAIGISMRGPERSATDAAGKDLPMPDVAPIFATARQEFQKALASLQFTTQVLVIVAGVSAAACLGGVVVAAAWKQIVGVPFSQEQELLHFSPYLPKFRQLDGTKQCLC
jgi:hypothetical protein